MKKITFTLLFALCAITSAWAQSGTCGDNLTWSYHIDTNTPTIEGTGAMTNYESMFPHWVRYPIQSVSLSNGVTTIGNSAFSGCSNLTSITCHATTPHIIDATTFDSVDKTIPVYVPEGSVEDYQAATGWKDFTNYKEITTTGITQHLAAGKEFTLQGNTLLFTEIQTVEVYTINGEQVYSGTTQRVDLPQAGVYMVRTPQAVGKVVVR